MWRGQREEPKRGPEQVVSKQAGTIIPYGALGAAAPIININVEGSVDKRTADQITMRAEQMVTRAKWRME